MLLLVPMTLLPGEPHAGPWRRVSADEVLAAVLPRPGASLGPVPVLAVDGRSAGGKTTVAEQLRAAVADAVVVHTDDVAWHHSFFDWVDLLRGGVLEPVHRGRLPVRYRPSAWDERSREGAIEVPATCRLLLVEGVGAGRRELADLVDALVWVQSDVDEARRRGIARDGGEAAEDFWEEWDAEEVPFLADQSPWERADLFIAGTSVFPAVPAAGLAAADPWRRARSGRGRAGRRLPPPLTGPLGGAACCGAAATPPTSAYPPQGRSQRPVCPPLYG